MQIEADAISIHFEIPAQDAMGHDHVEGKLQGMEDRLIMHWKLQDRPFANVREELRTLELEYHQIETVELVSKFLRPKHLLLKVTDPTILDGIPGVQMGKVDLVIEKKSKSDVDRLAKFVDYKVSEFRMEKTQERMDALRDSDLEDNES